jgi:hypothetical protein
MQLAPFQPLGNAFILTTSATPSAIVSVALDLRGLLNILSAAPGSLRLLNKGTADIWISIGAANPASLIPVGGTTTLGTPVASVWLEPGVDLVLTFPQAGQLGQFLNMASSVASQQFYGQFGDGA